MKVIVTRAFNHTGPRRGEQFATSSFAKQVAEVEKGKLKVIKTGDLNSIRDFTDVRDIVQAYWLAANECLPGEVYNICSGKGWHLYEVLDTLASYSSYNVSVIQNGARMRPSDVPVLLGDSTKFREQTSWAPAIPFEQTLLDLLNYWRERV